MIFVIVHFLTGRSISVFLTTLVTVERYLVVTYPLRSRNWFNRYRTKVQALLILFLVTIFCLPRFFSLEAVENIYSDKENHLNVSSMAKFNFILKRTRIYLFWKDLLGDTPEVLLRFFEFWILNPVLVMFNIWSYRKVINI